MQKQDRRRHLLECARRVFARKGYHQASVDDVIREARVARGTFYNYFESKRAVFQEVLEELFELIWTSVTPIRVGDQDDVRSQIASNLLSLCQTLERDRDVARILLSSASGLDPEADRALAAFYESCRERLSRALRRGQELGIVGEGDARTLAICIMGILKEYRSQLLLDMSPPALETFLPEIHRFFRAGWLREPGVAAQRRRRSR